jgi:hypothetical protein
MGSLLLPLAYLITVVFIVLPIALSVAIIHRYRQVERTTDHYAATIRALIAYLERGQRPDPTEQVNNPRPAPQRSGLLASLVRFWRGTPPMPTLVHTYNLADDFEDYLSVIREGATENERFIRFKRKNFKMHQVLIRDIEYCRTSVETLPYLGILGTVLGFFFSPAIFTPTASTASAPVATVGGLVLALASTAVALICLILIKIFYENRIVPKFIEFEQSLQVLDDYAKRYGDIGVGLST